MVETGQTDSSGQTDSLGMTSLVVKGHTDSSGQIDISKMAYLAVTGQTEISYADGRLGSAGSKSIKSPESCLSSPSVVVQLAGISSMPSLSLHALLPALAPGQLIHDASALGRSSSLLPSLAMAHQSRWALALSLWWALANALHSGVTVGWVLGPEWGW